MTKKKFGFVLYFFLIAFLMISCNASTSELTLDYFVVLTSFVVVTCIWYKLALSSKSYIFEPATMVLTLTIITYSIEPLYSINTNDLTIAGKEVFSSCVLSTLIYSISIICFMLAYYGNFGTNDAFEVSTDNQNRCIENEAGSVSESKRRKYVAVAYILSLVGIVVMYLDLVQNGYNLNYILSLGMSGEYIAESESTVGVFINLRYLAIPAFLYLDEYARNKKLVWVLRIITLMGLLVRGSRWIIIILLLSPIVFRFVKQRKSPTRRQLAIIFVVAVFIVGALQFSRTFIREGGGVSSVAWNDFNLSYIWGAFSGNFDMYKTLYAAVNYFPEEHFFTMGQSIFTTLLMVIPHSIWPSRPSSIIGQLYSEWMGAGAVSGHWAHGQMATMYIEFGAIGCAASMFVFGRMCRSIKKCGLNNHTSIKRLIIFSFMWPMLMQLVIRGDLSISFWPVFFCFIAVWFIETVVNSNIGE